MSQTARRWRFPRPGAKPGAMTEPLDLCHWINGERVPAERSVESLNPSDTRELVARAPQGGGEEVNAAVEAASAAFPAWAEASPEVRSDILDRAGTLRAARRARREGPLEAALERCPAVQRGVAARQQCGGAYGH